MPVLFIIVIVLIASGCEQKPQVRHYTETVIEPAETSVSTANGALRDHLVWDLPLGWRQEPGNAMRLATFHLSSDPDAFDCSIVSLGGMAGGIEANLTRWMKQVQIEVAQEELDRFLRLAPAVMTKAGASAAIYDFTDLQKASEGSTKSILAAVLHLGEATIFVKMSATIDSLRTNRAGFLAFIQSIRNP